MLIQNPPTSSQSLPPDLKQQAKAAQNEYTPISLKDFLDDFKSRFQANNREIRPMKDGFMLISGKQQYSLRRVEDCYLLQKENLDTTGREACVALRIPVDSTKRKASGNSRFIIQLKRNVSNDNKTLSDNKFLSDTLLEIKTTKDNKRFAQTAEALFKHQEKRHLRPDEKAKFVERPVVWRSGRAGSAGIQHR